MSAQSIDNLSAVVLTGTRNQHLPLLQGTGLTTKVLLPICGKPMVSWVLDTLGQIDACRHINISAQHAEDFTVFTEKDPAVSTIACGETAVDSFMKGIEQTTTSDWVLLISGDHPLITTDMIETFMAETSRRELAISYAMVSSETLLAKYPDSKRTYLKVKNGAFSGANMFLVDKTKFRTDSEFYGTFDRNRKTPWKNVFILKPWDMFLFLTRQLTLDDCTDRLEDITGFSQGVVVLPQAEACMDVDKPSDFDMAEAVFKARGITDPAKDSPTDMRLSPA